MGENKKVRCDVYAKVVGYCRKVSSWNVGKQQEMKDRKFAKLK